MYFCNFIVEAIDFFNFDDSQLIQQAKVVLSYFTSLLQNLHFSRGVANTPRNPLRLPLTYYCHSAQDLLDKYYFLNE